MAISTKYRAVLARYLEWENVRTPASGSFQESKLPRPLITAHERGVSAGEALCVWESTGKEALVKPEEWGLLQRYIRGKAQRDWWTKEIGWWEKNAAFMPEEFLAQIGPLPFIELFGRMPITRIVRFLYDNTYATWEFDLDSKMAAKVDDWNMSYYERDDRHTAIENARRMISVKFIQPNTYKLRASWPQLS